MVYTWRWPLTCFVGLQTPCASCHSVCLVAALFLLCIYKCVLGKSCWAILYSLRQLFGYDVLAKVYNWRELCIVYVVGYNVYHVRARRVVVYAQKAHTTVGARGPLCTLGESCLAILYIEGTHTYGRSRVLVCFVRALLLQYICGGLHTW